MNAVTKQNPLDPRRAMSMVQQLLRGLDYCHGHGVIHRDLKPENILIGAHGDVKIADFGLARAFTMPTKVYTHEVLTLWYRAPEVLLGASCYSLGVDVWSAGCIFAELFCGHPLWPAVTEISMLLAMFRLLGTPTVHMWPGVELLPHYSPLFPKWPTQKLIKEARALEGSAGADLLKRMLTYDPAARISAKAALQHPYFSEA